MPRLSLVPVVTLLRVTELDFVANVQRDNSTNLSLYKVRCVISRVEWCLNLVFILICEQNSALDSDVPTINLNRRHAVRDRS